MNARRVAELHRELARVYAELADELDAESGGGESSVPPVDELQSRPRASRKPRSIVRPPGTARPEIAAMAARNLKARGLR